jgi:hypothetical protein
MAMRLITTLLLCVCMLCTVQAAVAMQVGHTGISVTGGEFGPQIPAADTFQNGGMTLSQAVEQVRRQYNGQIVSAETKVNGKQETHIIKVLTQDGKVKTVRVPGRRLN